MTYSQPLGHAKTGPLRYTETYVFNSADCLGKGATASVYLGRHRDNGDVVAVKVFNVFGSRQIGACRNRELQLLPRISHKNVMKFIACETERDSNQEVLVMEYCQGGSLFTVLEQPQNGYGLEEHEFLRFLTDLSNGLQYLRSKAIIHRDIKPGNIMKRVDEDGSVSYVITDFGSSRELGDDETFMSLHGTEEYLHPEMYQLAVLRHAGSQSFTSSTDLWSLGVTIYHVATGRLPFQAYEGRANTQTMFQITSSRKSGVISGVQLEQNGKIVWSRKLPVTCHLSEGLKRLVEPVLAGLFETDPKKAPSFEKYFEMVNTLTNMVTLKVFNSQRGTNLTVYARPIDNFTDLQEKLASMTEISARSQLILLHHRDLKTVVERRDHIRTYPKAILNAQLFLFEKDNYEMHGVLAPEIPPFPSLVEHATVSQDAGIARRCAAVAYYLQTQTEVVLAAQDLLRQATSCLRQYVRDTLKPLEVCVPKLEFILELTKRRHDTLLVSQENLSTVVKILELTKVVELTDSKTDVLSYERLDFCSTENGLNGIIQKANTRLEEIKLYKSVLVQRMKEQEDTHRIEGAGCLAEDHCLSKIKQVCQDTHSVFTTFGRHKKYGELHPHEQFIHKVERQRLSDQCVKLLSLFQGHCLFGLNQVHQAEQNQSSTLMRHFTRAGKVETNVKCVTDCQNQINEKLNKLDSLYKTASLTMTSRIQRIVTGDHVTPSNGKRPDSMTSANTLDKPEITEYTSHKFKAASLIDRLVTEIGSLHLETSELDRLMKSNTDSLLDLKRMLQDTNNLNTDSFCRDQL